MAIVLLVVGTIMLVAAVRNTQNCLVILVQADFIGPNNFFYWVLAITIVGAIGYIEKLKKVSDGLLVLIFVALFLSRGKASSGNFFQKFLDAIGATNTAASIKGQGFFGGSAINIGGVTVGVPSVTAGPGGVTIGPTRQPTTPTQGPGPTSGPIGGGPIIVGFGPGVGGDNTGGPSGLVEL